jgi:hypothetical protein
VGVLWIDAGDHDCGSDHREWIVVHTIEVLATLPTIPVGPSICFGVDVDGGLRYAPSRLDAFRY